MIRTTILALAAGFAAFAAAPAFAEPAPAQCEATNVRVYFAPGSAQLDATAQELLQVAERQMASCGHAELHVRTSADALSQARGQAILAATHGQNWDVARVDAVMAQRVAFSAGPDFVEVAMTPEHVAPTQATPVRGEAGV